MEVTARSSARTVSRWRRAADVLALKRDPSILLIALLLTLAAEKIWIGFAPKYLATLGASILVIGLYDALHTFMGAVYAYPGGWLTERLGQRRSLLLFNAVSLAGYVLALLWQHWLALVIGVFLFSAWSALSLPATFTVIAASLDQRQHTMGVGVQSLMRRLPMMIGPMVGGWLITRFGWTAGVRYALTICIALSVATAAVQWFMSDSPGSVRATAANSRLGFVGVVKTFSPTLRELLISDILVRFCERLPYAFVILWAIDRVGVTPAQFGYLVAIEMGTAMLCYVPVAHFADKHGQRPFVQVTFLFFTLFPLSLLFASTFAGLVAAFVVRGLKEFGEPARKALIIAQAAPELRARTYGAYYLIRDCLVTSGSLAGAWLWSISPAVNFTAAATCGLAGTIWFARHALQSDLKSYAAVE